MSWIQYELNISGNNSVERLFNAVIDGTLTALIGCEDVQIINGDGTMEYGNAEIRFETNKNIKAALNSYLTQECTDTAYAICFYLDERANECGYFAVNLEAMEYNKPNEHFEVSYPLFDSVDEFREEFEKGLNIIANEDLLIFISRYMTLEGVI